MKNHGSLSCSSTSNLNCDLAQSNCVFGSENRDPNLSSASAESVELRPLLPSTTNAPCSCPGDQDKAPKHAREPCDFSFVSPPRKHVCNSRRCASKNPDYALPVPVQPKKFLVSKRRLLQPQETLICKCCLRRTTADGNAGDSSSQKKHQCTCAAPSRSQSSAANALLEQNCEIPAEKNHCGIEESHTGPESLPPLSEEQTMDHDHSCETESANVGKSIARDALTSTPGCAQEPTEVTPTCIEFPMSEDARDFRASVAEIPVIIEPEEYGKTVSACDIPENNNLRLPSSGTIVNPGTQVISDGEGTPSTAVAFFVDCHRLNDHEEDDSLEDGYGAEEDAGFLGSSNRCNPNSASSSDVSQDSGGLEPPEKTGNWRLQAVLEAFGNLSPTREGRVKVLVKAFESLMCRSDNEEQNPKPRAFPLQFSYLNQSSGEGETCINSSPPSYDREDTAAQAAENDEEGLEEAPDMPAFEIQSDHEERRICGDTSVSTFEEATGFGQDDDTGATWPNLQHICCETGVSTFEVTSFGQDDDTGATWPKSQHDAHNDRPTVPIFVSETLRKKPNAKHHGTRKHNANSNSNLQKKTMHGRRTKTECSIKKDNVGQACSELLGGFGNLNSMGTNPKEHVPSSKRALQKSRKPEWRSKQNKTSFIKPEPFKLRTEERGHLKEQEFMTRLQKMLAEEERLRVPLAQGLPWTTDEPEALWKPPVKDTTNPLDIQLNTEIRAMERAEFDKFVSEKLFYWEQQRLEKERLRKIAEEEEIKKMRKDMVPKAQLMPYFDRPFMPRRSSKRPTIPKEPQLRTQAKRPKCAATSTSKSVA